jgi:hypothetical protein
MAADPTEHVTITAEHFLGPLGMPDLSAALPDRRRELFAALVEDLAERGLVADIPRRPQSGSADEVDLRVPGTPVHVHLSAIGDMHITELVGLAAGLGLHQRGGSVITLAGLKMLSRLFSFLRTECGGRSIVEALTDAEPPTADIVVGVLHGAPCRHPRASCRYNSNGYCAISSSDVATTLDDLAKRQIVTRRNAVEPFEYSITI